MGGGGGEGELKSEPVERVFQHVPRGPADVNLSENIEFINRPILNAGFINRGRLKIR